MTFLHEDRVVLVVDEELARDLDGQSIVAEAKEGDTYLVLR